MLRIESVATEAVVREDGPDVAVERNLRRAAADERQEGKVDEDGFHRVF
jgi:hypothetical protein